MQGAMGPFAGSLRGGQCRQWWFWAASTPGHSDLAGSGGGVSRASSRLAVNAVHLAVNDLKDEDIYNIKIENRKMLNIQNYVVKHTKGALPWADVHSFFYFLLSIFHFWGSHVRPLFCSS